MSKDPRFIITHLYCDGGLLGPNPCALGGTWAWCFVNEAGNRIADEVAALDPHEAEDMGLTSRKWQDYGLLLPSQVAPFETVSNNITELIAMLRGMRHLPASWSGTICTDSNVTLCRVANFREGEYSRKKLADSVPAVMIDMIACQRARLGHLRFLLHDGHPTCAQLEAGIGKRGNPVSLHNVWADEMCNEVKAKFFEERGKA